MKLTQQQILDLLDNDGLELNGKMVTAREWLKRIILSAWNGDFTEKRGHAGMTTWRGRMHHYLARKKAISANWRSDGSLDAYSIDHNEVDVVIKEMVDVMCRKGR